MKRQIVKTDVTLINDTADFFELHFLVTLDDETERIIEQRFDARPPKVEQMRYAMECAKIYADSFNAAQQ